MTYNPYLLKDVHASSQRKRFTAIDTFAGGGGTSTGLKLAGAHELLVNEFVQEASDAFSVNYPDVKVLTADIKELTGQDFLDAVGMKEGELDLLGGSPPCSAFSINGKQDKGWGQEKSYSTGKKVQNIEDLFFEYIRVAEQIRPKVILAENVQGLMASTCSEYLNKILNTFREIGYTTTVKVLYAKEFNTAQNRPRCFFIGVRNDIAKRVGLNIMSINRVFPQPTGSATIREAFVNLEQDPAHIKEITDKFKKSSKYDLVIKHMPLDPIKHIRLSDRAGTDSFFNCHRFAQDKPCSTLTVVGSTPSLANFLHPTEQRPLSVPEFKRIMGLPDDYYVGVRLDHQYERVARMVAPRVMEAIGNSVYEKVLQHVR